MKKRKKGTEGDRDVSYGPDKHTNPDTGNTEQRLSAPACRCLTGFCQETVLVRTGNQ